MVRFSACVYATRTWVPCHSFGNTLSMFSVVEALQLVVFARVALKCSAMVWKKGSVWLKVALTSAMSAMRRFSDPM